MFRHKEKNVFREKKKNKLLPVLFLLLAGSVVFVPFYLGQLVEKIYAEQTKLITNTFDMEITSEKYQKNWFSSAGEIQTKLPFDNMSATVHNNITHRPIVLDKESAWLPKFEYATITSDITIDHPEHHQGEKNTIHFTTGIPDKSYAQSTVDNQSLALINKAGKPFFYFNDLVANMLLLHQENQVTGGLKISSIFVAKNNYSAQLHNVSFGFNFLAAASNLLTKGDFSYAADSALIKYGDTKFTINNIWGYYISILNGDTVNVKKRIEFRELNNGFLVIGPGSMEVQLDNVNGQALHLLPQIVSLIIQIKTDKNPKNKQTYFEQLQVHLEKLVPKQATLHINDLRIAMLGSEISGEISLHIPAIKNQKINQWLGQLKLDATLSLPSAEIHKYIAAASQYTADEIQEIMDEYVTDGNLLRDKSNYLALARLRSAKLSFNGKATTLSMATLKKP